MGPAEQLNFKLHFYEDKQQVMAMECHQREYYKTLLYSLALKQHQNVCKVAL